MSEAKIAFVLAGGGSLGAIQVGMLRALLAAGVRPDFIIGSSVGAMNACYFAGHPDAQGVESLADIWIGLRRRQVFPFNFATAIALLGRMDYFIDPSPLRRLIEAQLPYERLEEARLPVHLVATDMQGFAVTLSAGPAVEAILASSAVPGIFPMVEIDGMPLMDGAVAANTPLCKSRLSWARREFLCCPPATPAHWKGPHRAPSLEDCTPSRSSSPGN